MLERELLDPSHDTADRTAIVQSLAELGQRSSLPVLERLRAATAAAPPAEDELGRALDAELLSAIDEATRTLAR